MPISLSNSASAPCFTIQDLDILEEMLASDLSVALEFVRKIRFSIASSKDGDDVFALDRMIIELEWIISGKDDDTDPLEDIISDCREILAASASFCK